MSNAGLARSLRGNQFSALFIDRRKAPAGAPRQSAGKTAGAGVIEDNQTFILGLVYGTVGLLAWFAQSTSGLTTPWLVSMVLALFCLHLLALKRSIADPTVFFAFGMLMYSSLPLLADTAGDTHATLGFDLRDAYELYNLGQISTMFGVGLAARLIQTRGDIRQEDGEAPVVLSMVGLIGAVLSLALSVVYVALHGIVLGGDTSYGQGFIDRMDTGSGVLALNVYFGLIGYIAALINRRRSLRGLVIPTIAMIMIFVSQGQRKYMLEIVLFAAVVVWRPKKMIEIMAFIAGGIMLFIVFSFLGYLREESLPITTLFDVGQWIFFFGIFGQYVGSETVALYATAASSLTEVVKALPNAGDYLQAWKMCIPQFIFHNDFMALNDRFGITFDGAAAVQGMGWGYSFLGEAYSVGGYLAIPVVVALHLMFARFIYVRGNRDVPVGAWGIISVAVSYDMLWIQRNAFAYVFKDYLYLIVTTMVTFFIARLAASMFERVGRKGQGRLTPQPRWRPAAADEPGRAG